MLDSTFRRLDDCSGSPTSTSGEFFLNFLLLILSGILETKTVVANICNKEERNDHKLVILQVPITYEYNILQYT